jgi:1-acyl-sn-glycerol-3-phosphate acyltransferase
VKGDRSIPPLGTAVPRRGGPLSRAFGRLVLRVFRWRIEGGLPNLPRFVVIGAPHTSSWDFVFGISTILALGVDLRWMGKSSLFRPPFGRILKRLGGLPIDRSRPHGLVDQTIAAFAEREKLVVGIMPEGTRKRVAKWKTGFYRIASGADVPIVPARLDYGRRCVGIGSPLSPSGNLEGDLRVIRDFYGDVAARHPPLFDLEAVTALGDPQDQRPTLRPNAG